MNGDSRKWMKFRIATLLAFFLVLFVALGSRAFQLQVLCGADLKALASKQHTQTLQLHPARGIIFDRNGEKMAGTIMSDSVCADPSKIERPAEAAAALASISNRSASILPASWPAT
jgi:cell division protein FtsI (penicillin-binding protein 3)